jgi:hypothetical protein
MDATTEAMPEEAAPPEAAPDVGRPVDSGVDAAFDAAAEADAGPAPVVVTVVGAAGPEPGVLVAFDDSNGHYLSTSTTDAQGRVTQVLASGSMVTALLGDPNTYPILYTVMGVEPGDALTVVDWGSIPSDYGQTRAACSGLDFPNLPPAPDGGTALLTNAGTCSAYEPNYIPLGGNACPSSFVGPGMGPSGCIGVGPNGLAAFPALVQAFDTNDNPVGYLFQKNVPLAIPVDGGGDSGVATQDVSLAGPWLTGMNNQTMTIANDYDGSPGFAPLLSEVVGGTLTPPAQLIATPTFTMHPGFADYVQAEATSTLYFQSALAIATTLPTPTADGTIPIDVSPLAAMPILSGVQVDATTAAQPVISWTTSSGSLSTVTGILAFDSWDVSTDGGTSTGTWMIVSPPTAQTQLQAPELSGAASAWAPVSGATIYNGNLVVWGVQGSALPTYAAVRAAAGAFPELPECSIYAPVVPALSGPNETLMITVFASGYCG